MHLHRRMHKVFGDSIEQSQHRLHIYGSDKRTGEERHGGGTGFLSKGLIIKTFQDFGTVHVSLESVCNNSFQSGGTVFKKCGC